MPTLPRRDSTGIMCREILRFEVDNEMPCDQDATLNVNFTTFDTKM